MKKESMLIEWAESKEGKSKRSGDPARCEAEKRESKGPGAIGSVQKPIIPSTYQPYKPISA